MDLLVVNRNTLSFGIGFLPMLYIKNKHAYLQLYYKQLIKKHHKEGRYAELLLANIYAQTTTDADPDDPCVSLVLIFLAL